MCQNDVLLTFFRNLRFKKQGIGRGGREHGVNTSETPPGFRRPFGASGYYVYLKLSPVSMLCRTYLCDKVEKRRLSGVEKKKGLALTFSRLLHRPCFFQGGML